jgi:hypothetical protein
MHTHKPTTIVAPPSQTRYSGTSYYRSYLAQSVIGKLRISDVPSNIEALVNRAHVAYTDSDGHDLPFHKFFGEMFGYEPRSWRECDTPVQMLGTMLEDAKVTLYTYRVTDTKYAQDTRLETIHTVGRELYNVVDEVSGQLGPNQELGISNIVDGDRMLPMIDLSIDSTVTNVASTISRTASIRRLCDLINSCHQIIPIVYKTDRSYHIYGDILLDMKPSKWYGWLCKINDRIHEGQNSYYPIVDYAWVGYGVEQGESVLRLTNNADKHEAYPTKATL